MALAIEDYRIVVSEYNVGDEKPGIVHLAYKVYDDVAETSEWKGLVYEGSLETAMLTFFTTLISAAETAEGI